MGVDHGARRAIFLDRDGVVVAPLVRDGLPYPPACLADLEILPGVREALLRLRDAGFRLVLVTNQPDIARGTQRREVVDQINRQLVSELPLDDVRVCPHDDADRCRCRKPEPGMIEDASAEGRIDLAASYMIGDRWRDVEAGRRAGCRTVFIDRGYAEPAAIEPDLTVGSLPEAADWILSTEDSR